MAYELTLDDLEQHMQKNKPPGKYQLSLADLDEHMKKMPEQVPLTRPVQPKTLKEGIKNLGAAWVEGMNSLGLPNLGANLVSAIPETGAAIANTPHVFGIGPELVHVPSWMPSRSPNLPDTPFARMMGEVGTGIGTIGPGSAIYKTLEALTGGASTATPIRKLLSGLGIGTATTQSEEPSEKVAGGVAGASLPFALPALKNAGIRAYNALHVKKLEQEAQKMWEQFHADKAAGHFDVVNSKSQNSGPGRAPNIKIDPVLAKIEHEKLQKEHANLIAQINKIEQHPTENILPPATGEHLVPQAEQHLANVKNLHNEATAGLSKHLNEGAAHEVHLARKAVAAIEPERQAIRDEYTAIDKDLKKQKVYVPTSKENEEIALELHHEITKNGAQSPAIGKAINDLKNSDLFHKIPANEYLNHYRNIRDLGHKAMADAKKAATAGERTKLYEEGRAYLKLSKKMNTILEHNIGTDNAKRLSEVNERFKNYELPIRKNKQYKNMMLGTRKGPNGENIPIIGKSSPNMMSALSTEASGNDIIKNVIKSDPEALKHVIGQKYASEPHKLHKPNELANEYLEHMPETKAMIEQHKQLGHEVEKAKQGVETAKAQHEAIKTEGEQAKKAFEEKVESNEHRQGLKNQVVKVREQLDSIEQKIHQYEAQKKQLAEHNKLKAEHEQQKASGQTGTKMEALRKKVEEEKRKKAMSDLDKKIAQAHKDGHKAWLGVATAAAGITGGLSYLGYNKFKDNY